eukprot:3777425-Alexandrium_andersonii.AAC.1
MPAKRCAQLCGGPAALHLPGPALATCPLSRARTGDPRRCWERVGVRCGSNCWCPRSLGRRAPKQQRFAAR